MKDFGGNVKKLPLYVGQKMMDMVHHLNENLRENMSNTVYGQNPLVWEMFCSKDSALAEACMREGIPVERINLAQGFDLYKPETYTTLLHLFRQQRPKKVWISTMRTLFCSWVDLNYHDRREVLDKRRRRERKMFRLLTAFLLQVLTEFPDTDLFWEWPLRCRAWNDPIILKFFESLRTLYECRIDGCRYGLKSEAGNFFDEAMDDQDHEHPLLLRVPPQGLLEEPHPRADPWNRDQQERILSRGYVPLHCQALAASSPT